jgi:hypothetical protein
MELDQVQADHDWPYGGFRVAAQVDGGVSVTRAEILDGTSMRPAPRCFNNSTPNVRAVRK